MSISKVNGHSTYFDKNTKQWRFSDTNEIVKETPRTCFCCGKETTKEGADGCLGMLPKTLFACCGHGNIKEAYIKLETGQTLRGEQAISMMRKLKKERK